MTPTLRATLLRLKHTLLLSSFPIAAVAGCLTEAEEESAEEMGFGGPMYGVAPMLGDDHPGWTNPDCDSCHALPVVGHTVTDRFLCAHCHGANGACFTNGFNETYNDHTPEDDCVSCHLGGNHRFTESVVCSNCHFREVGQRSCEGYVPPTTTTPSSYPAPGQAPTLSTELEPGCFGFPGQPFSQGNAVAEPWQTILQPNDLAVEFELEDTAGVKHKLSDLLATKPVWLQTGSYTCPVYRNAVASTLNPLMSDGNATGAYVDQIHFVHVYTVEAHPTDAFSPYAKNLDLAPEFHATQPLTFAERLNNANLMKPLLSGSELFLVDDLGSVSDNPVWCTYATCPSCSLLISRDGYVKEVLANNNSDDDAKSALDWFLAQEATASAGQ